MIYIFDMDGTLYPRSSTLHAAITTRIYNWLSKACSVEEERVEEFYLSLKSQYQDIISAIKVLNLDADDYHRYVFHDLDVNEHLTINHELANLLTDITAHKYVVTRSPRIFAEKVLQSLGIRNSFEQIYVLGEDWSGSSKLRAYELIRETEQALSTEVCVVGDNYEVDLRSASQHGYKCVLVKDDLIYQLEEKTKWLLNQT